jgi:hypothetical protein
MEEKKEHREVGVSLEKVQNLLGAKDIALLQKEEEIELLKRTIKELKNGTAK